MRTVAIVVAVLLAVALLFAGILLVVWMAAPGVGQPHMGLNWGWGSDPDSWGGPGIGWLGMLLMILAMGFLWLLVPAGIALLIWFAVSQSRPAAPSTRQEAPLDVLRRRYARGEIDREEFLRRKEDL